VPTKSGPDFEHLPDLVGQVVTNVTFSRLENDKTSAIAVNGNAVVPAVQLGLEASWVAAGAGASVSAFVNCARIFVAVTVIIR
jgi:hypothetical protein